MPIPAPRTSLKPRSKTGSVDIASSQAHSSGPPSYAEEAEVSTNDGGPSAVQPSLSRPLSSQNTVEGSKRRLIQPRYSTRSSVLVGASDQDNEQHEPIVPTMVPKEKIHTTNATAEVNTDNALRTRLRPRSMYQASNTSSQGANASQKITSQSMRPPVSVSRLPEPRTSGLGRTQSLRKPGVPSQSTRPTGIAAHSRTQSVSATTDIRRDPTKPASGSERPRSLLLVPNSNMKISAASSDAAVGGTKLTGRLVGLQRTASIKTRSDVSSSGAAPRPEEPHVAQPDRREVLPEESRKLNRPAFSTLQQHFTPRKVGKAPTSTFLHPAPSTSTHTLPPEIASLQAELLQLHLLHQPSSEVNRCWEASAKRCLHAKFEEVASLHQLMLEYERDGQEQKNLRSLLEWSSGSSSAGLVEHMQILSEPLHEIPSLVESNGRLQRLVGDFERWMLWVQEVRSARHKAARTPAGSGTIESLGDTWKAENAALTRKLTSFARDLDSLDVPSPESSIEYIVESCKALLHGILEELHTMQSIEVEVVSKEKSWVEDRLRVIARDDQVQVDTLSEHASWRL